MSIPTALPENLSIAIGSDHAGFELKEALVAYFKDKGIAYEDVGPQNADRVDYPDYSRRVAQAMQANKHPFGVLLCGSGIGVSMAANRFEGIRAVNAHDLWSAKMSRLHNDANVLCMGGRVIAAPYAIDILETFLSTSFEGGRHQGRVELMDNINKPSHC